MTNHCGGATGKQPIWQRESHPDFDTVFSILRKPARLSLTHSRRHLTFLIEPKLSMTPHLGEKRRSPSNPI